MTETPIWAPISHAGHKVPQAWVDLLATHAAITRELNARMVAEHGLSLTSYEVLLFLSWAPDGRLSRSELADGVLFTQGGITRLLKGLEDAGLVASAPSDTDRRVTFALLTPLGKRRFKRAARDHAADVDRLFARHFSPDELRALTSLLGQLPGAKPSA